MNTSETSSFSSAQSRSGIVMCAYEDACKRADSENKETARKVGDIARHISSGLFQHQNSVCHRLSADISVRAARLERYNTALLRARAAEDLNKLKDDNGGEVIDACLERLPLNAEELNKELGLLPGTISEKELRDDWTGFRAALYRSKVDGTIMLVGRDTQPQSLVDWETNFENGEGKDTKQYRSMRVLSSKLAKAGVNFEAVGYSKGGGLAQEAGLASPNSKVFVFNSAGLPDESLQRHGAESFDSLAARTQAYNTEGDFLTIMNDTTDRGIQIKNAKYLRRNLEGERLFLYDPMEITYTDPSTKNSNDGAFKENKDEFLKYVDGLIEKFETQPSDRPLFPPVRAAHKEVIPSPLAGNFAPGAEINILNLRQHQIHVVTDNLASTISMDRQSLKNFQKLCS